MSDARGESVHNDGMNEHEQLREMTKRTVTDAEYRRQLNDLLADIRRRTEEHLLGGNLNDVTFIASARHQIRSILGHNDFDLSVEDRDLATTLVITLRPAGWVSISFSLPAEAADDMVEPGWTATCAHCLAEITSVEVPANAKGEPPRTRLVWVDQAEKAFCEDSPTKIHRLGP